MNFLSNLDREGIEPLKSLFCLIFFVSVSQTTYAAPLAFAHGGKFKMLYDCRQRPQSVYLKDRLYIVYNGDAGDGAVVYSGSNIH